MILNKTCRLCNKVIDISRFSIRSDSGKFRTECKDCLNEKRRSQPGYQKWHKENKKRVKEYMKYYDIKRHYGVDKSEYINMKEKQKNKCGICEKELKKPHLDHCHKSGDVRGLLCRACNHGLGNFKDSEKFLKNAIKYLNKKH